ncbi:MAG: RimK family alpha-L-glutamate ligase [Candidatus Aenigmarchaeota archaeon]|nr:RimK family alpha-L-glutamate ligase [Candidatus Aenigmarchaeota archaeon]
MMKLAILGPGNDAAGYTTKRLLEEARKQFKKACLVPVAEVMLKVNDGMDAMWEGRSILDYDYILPRIDSKRAQIGYHVMRFLDETGVRKPFSASSIVTAHNKFLTLIEMVRRDIPVPETWITGSKDMAGGIIDKQKMPVIMKLLSGFGGEGVMIMESKEAAKATIHTMKTLKQEILIEKYLPNPGEDIRGIVAGDEVIASFKRIANSGEQKANIHLGGRGVDFKLSPEMREIVLKAAKAIGSKICAIDMVESKGKAYVIEANINPGLKGIEKATNINVAQRIIDFVRGEIRR